MVEGDESYREYILAALDGDSDGDCRCSLGMHLVHYDYRYSIRKAIFKLAKLSLMPFGATVA